MGSDLEYLERSPGHLIRHRGKKITEEEIWATVQLLPIPGDHDDRYGAPRLTSSWLSKFKSPHTVAAYGRDLAQWLMWCEEEGLDPLEVRRADVDRFIRSLDEADRPPVASTIARKLSAISSWYKYLASNRILGHNPLSAVDRPEFDKDRSKTVGLSVKEVWAFMARLRLERGPQAVRDRAMLGVLLELGLRVGELARADIADVHHRAGHRALLVHGKGGRDRVLPIPAPVALELDAYLEQRAADAGVPVEELEGPLFVTSGAKAQGELERSRLTQPHVFALIRRIAKAAEIPSWRSLSPHSFRHTAATAALNDGASLRDVQDFLGHADPRTTRRYDRDRGALERSPAYRLASLFAPTTDED
jgi:site-specific recombinase XerD